MRKCLAVVMLVCMIGGAMSMGVALAEEGEADATQQTLPQIEPVPFDFTQPIKVGYRPTFTDLVNDLDSANNRGYGYEIFEKMEEISDLQFEYVPVAGSMTEAVNSGYVDIAGFDTKTEADAQEVLHSTIWFGKSYVALLTQDLDIAYADAAAIDSKTVATYEGNLGTAALDDYCAQHGISVNYVYGQVEDYMELAADFYIGYSANAATAGLHNALNLGVYNLYAMTSLQNQELMQTIDGLFFQIVTTEGNFFLELEQKYLADNTEINHRDLTRAELETLRQRPLEVGYMEGFAPITYTNEQGEADGAMVQTFNHFAEQYGFTVNYHPYELHDGPEVYNDFDVLITLYGDGEEQLRHFDASESCFILSTYAQVARDTYNQAETLHDMVLASPKIGSLPYQSVDFDAFLRSYPDSTFVFYDDLHSLLDAFADGEIDMMLSTQNATTYAELYLDDMDRVSIITDMTIPVFFFVNKDISEDYLPIFNVILDRVAQEEYIAIVTAAGNSFLPSQETGFFEFLAKNWYYFAIAVVVIAAGFVALHYRGQIEKREALLAFHDIDPLTGLMAIQKFRETIDEVLKKAKPGEYELISFDIDMFKTINTHFSAEKGTATIVSIAEALKEAFIETEAIISRRTADQFLILRRVREGGEMRDIYNASILPAIEQNLNEKYKVSLSFGKVIIDKVKANGVTIIGQADSARAVGKNTHKTTFVIFDEKMRKQYDDKINITFRMEQALKDREFFIEFQPKIDFVTSQVGGAEALVRWNPRLGGKIYPDQFIPVFEENGFISYLDLYVLEEVCRYIQKYTGRMKVPRMSVNLSAHTVLAEDITQRILDVLERYKVTPEQIELELAENSMEEDAAQFLHRVKHLKKLGFCIAIDDFGAGVSSLNRLSAIEADILKLDKVFFEESERIGKSMIVVADVIRMAKRLGMKVVAEGVETKGQAQWLRSIHCDYAQGYYFAKPMSEADFTRLLIAQKGEKA